MQNITENRESRFTPFNKVHEYLDPHCGSRGVKAALVSIVKFAVSLLQLTIAALFMVTMFFHEYATKEVSYAMGEVSNSLLYFFNAFCGCIKM